ncbi:hypothetical protein [Clostridium uliginosum]|uniref:Uncharacterized protein n=1 Tax=Clostridium uliginosum TaxID=119641 RepID=A0A1I1J626_9CLOT|nr:hypothetical protein [Clostridium uliginosum]SFC42058.1 hypothetical protein SAMN05421842_103142 [Clostridium uliginosum]
MIKIKLDKNKKGQILFKLGITKEQECNLLFKRAIIESKKIKGSYNYEVPLRFFIPIFKNIGKEQLILDQKSIASYLEFSDYCDENYYTDVEPTVNYMKKWREEGCPIIYRVTIDRDDYSIEKKAVFKKPKIFFEDCTS